jgi:hypothetical protein
MIILSYAYCILHLVYIFCFAHDFTFNKTFSRVKCIGGPWESLEVLLRSLDYWHVLHVPELSNRLIWQHISEFCICGHGFNLSPSPSHMLSWRLRRSVICNFVWQIQSSLSMKFLDFAKFQFLTSLIIVELPSWHLCGHCLFFPLHIFNIESREWLATGWYVRRHIWLWR